MDLLGVGGEYGAVVGQGRLYQLETKSLWKTMEPEILGPLGLCQKAEIVEDAEGVQRRCPELNVPILCRGFSDERSIGDLILCNNLVEDGDDELLQRCGRGVVDDGILAGLEDEAYIQCSHQKVILYVRGIILQKRGQGLENLELNIETSICCLPESLKDRAELGPWQGFGNDEPLQTDDSYAGELYVLSAACYYERIDKVDLL